MISMKYEGNNRRGDQNVLVAAAKINNKIK